MDWGFFGSNLSVLASTHTFKAYCDSRVRVVPFGIISTLQLLAMDASARVTMKDAAKCDKRREWQNSENQENAERILHFQVIPGSMSTSGR